MTATSSGSPSAGPEHRGVRRRPRVVLDTNALFLPFRTGIVLDREVGRVLPGAELIVPEAVIAEVDRLVARGIRHAPAARKWAGGLRSVPSRSRGDEAVVEAAVQEGASVVTADRALTARLLARGVSVYAPRDRNQLHRVLSSPRRSTVPRAPPRRPAAIVKKRARLERG